MERAIDRFDEDDALDDLSLRGKPKPRGRRAEQEMFDPAVELNDLAGDALYIDKDIGRDQADQIVATAAAKMLVFVQNADSGSSELLDLMLKSQSDYATMIGEQLTGSSDETAWSPAQAECIKASAKTLFETVCRNTKDAVSKDMQTMTLAGKTYTLERQIGEGATSKAFKFIDPSTNEAVVVKKMNKPTPEEREVKDAAFRKEVLLHDRLMRGKVDGRESGNHIVEMKGMCLDPDGGRYVVMEVLEGGELGQAGNTLSAMTSSGSLPEEARVILASDMVGQLASGLLELERQGVLHGDIKSANVMITADGTVKVIDFGESSEVKAGESTGANAAGVSRLLEELISEVAPASLEDTRPLAGIGSMGKIMAGVNNPVESLRPSMEAILACSMFNRGGQDFPEEDIQDLKAAASDYSMRLGKVEVPFDPADYKAKTGAQLKKGIADRIEAGKPIDVALLAQEIGFIDTSIGAAFRDARNGKEVNMSVVADNNKTKAYLNGLIQKSVAAQDTAGKDAFEHLTKPPEKPDPRAPKDPVKEASEAARVKNNPTIQMDGPQGRETISLIDAKARQDQITQVINAMTRDFYDKMNLGEKFDAADIEMIDAQIEILKTQFAALQKALFDALGADAQFYISKQRLEDVGRRFGTPKAVTPQPEIERDKLEENLAYLNKLAEVREVKNATD
jgi:serine/threonine protein kinase